jgi:Terpene synthase family 2, C-terminal metal binding
VSVPWLPVLVSSVNEPYLVYARNCWPDGTAAEHRLLALQIGIITAIDDALDLSPPLASPAEEYRTLLSWHPSRRSAVAAARAPVRRAARCLEAALDRYARQTLAPASAPSDVASWWRSQAEALVAAAWQEARWRSSAPPDEATYLAVAEHSIGVGWLAATLVRLSGSPLAPLPGSRLQAAIRAVAVAVRTANDLADAQRERSEGKVQLLFLRARTWDYLGTPAEAERLARAELLTELAQRVGLARALLDPSGWADSPRLRMALDGMLTAALALYAEGTGGATHVTAGVLSGRVS